MTRDSNKSRKYYSAPSFKVLDASTAKAELKAKGDARDPNLPTMLSLIEKQKGRSVKKS